MKPRNIIPWWKKLARRFQAARLCFMSPQFILIHGIALKDSPAGKVREMKMLRRTDDEDDGDVRTLRLAEYCIQKQIEQE